MNILHSLAIVTVASLVLAGCAHTAETTTQTAPQDTTGATMEQEPGGEVMEGEAMEGEAMEGETSQVEADYTLELSNFMFNPDVIEAAPGETVTVEIRNVEGMHDFVLEEFNVSSEVTTAGDTTMVEIAVPADAEPGEYEFYCSIGNHRQMGMVGMLRVTAE